MAYVDGFVLALPKRKVKAYVQIARKAGKVFKDHGALEYREALGDDLKVKWGMPFPKAIRARTGVRRVQDRG